ncbi:MAG: substrate-binding domain-containing protein, partial [Casimicrobiaceae bacterium]
MMQYFLMPRQLLRNLLLAALAVVVIAAARQAQAQPSDPPPTLAAAADLKFAVAEVAQLFEKETGQKLRLVFGSSGSFYSQILQGAPFHLFMSADEAFVFKLA